MENPPHIVIIGAGLIGLSSADHLMDRGARITLLERRSGPGEGAGFCNSGMIHPSQAVPWFGPKNTDTSHYILELALRSRTLLLARLKALGQSCVSRPSGTVQLFDTARALQDAQRHYDTLGIFWNDVTGQPEAFGRSALRFPDDNSGNAYLYSRALAVDLVRRGVHIHYNVDEEALRETTKTADHILIAAGAQSVSVAELFGITLPITPAAGHALNFKRSDMILPDAPIMHHKSHSALTVFDDHVRLSGTIGTDSPKVLIEIWKDIAPSLIKKLGNPIFEWSGNRPVCGLGRPIIAHSGHENIWINTGHAHMGWTLCAGSGELISQLILEDSTDDRFGAPPIS